MLIEFNQVNWTVTSDLIDTASSYGIMISVQLDTRLLLTNMNE